MDVEEDPEAEEDADEEPLEGLAALLEVADELGDGDEECEGLGLELGLGLGLGLGEALLELPEDPPWLEPLLLPFPPLLPPPLPPVMT